MTIRDENQTQNRVKQTLHTKNTMDSVHCAVSTNKATQNHMYVMLIKEIQTRHLQTMQMHASCGIQRQLSVL